MSESLWEVESFQDRHEFLDFNCGEADLNDWLPSELRQDRKGVFAQTYVLLDHGQKSVRGFYTLSFHSVVCESTSQRYTELFETEFPAVLIGSLAVDEPAQGHGRGRFLLIDALRRSEYLATELGFRVVVVNAASHKAKSFYLKHGFLPHDDARRLFLPMQTILRLRLPPL